MPLYPNLSTVPLHGTLGLPNNNSICRYSNICPEIAPIWQKAALKDCPGMGRFLVIHIGYLKEETKERFVVSAAYLLLVLSCHQLSITDHPVASDTP